MQLAWCDCGSSTTLVAGHCEIDEEHRRTWHQACCAVDRAMFQAEHAPFLCDRWLLAKWEQAKHGFTGMDPDSSDTAPAETSCTNSKARKGKPVAKNPLQSLAEQLMAGQSAEDADQAAPATGSASRGATRIPLPVSLVQQLSPAQCSKAGIDASGPGAATMAFDVAAMCSLFDPAVNEAVGLAKRVLGNCAAQPGDSVRVLLAGGFSQSAYLQRRLTEALAQSERPTVQEVVVMKHAGAAVLQGGSRTGIR